MTSSESRFALFGIMLREAPLAGASHGGPRRALRGSDIKDAGQAGVLRVAEKLREYSRHGVAAGNAVL